MQDSTMEYEVVGEYKILKSQPLGSGKYSSVFVAIKANDKIEYAAKVNQYI